MGGKEHEHKYARYPSGDGVADKHNDRREVVKAGLVSDGLCNTQGDADAIHQNHGKNPEVQGDGNAFLHHVPHRIIIPGGGAQVAGHHLAQPQEVADQHRLVKAVVFFQFFDLLLGKGLALIFCGESCPHALHLPGLDNDPFNGAARYKPRDREHHNGDPDKGGDD